MRAVVDAPASKPTWGGARPGAGRKRRSPSARPNVAHRARPAHAHTAPVHVTVRARHGLPSFRAQRVHAMLTRVLTRQRKRAYAADFQVVHFSIQDNHVHVIVEAQHKAGLRAGVSGLVIAFAKRLNQLLGRARGKVWGDRYHARDLRTPTEVKNALSYVFQNWKKHGALVYGAEAVDMRSSALAFDGWSRPVATVVDTEPWRPPRTRTWLLGTGWKRRGLLAPWEAPAGSPQRMLQESRARGDSR